MVEGDQSVNGVVAIAVGDRDKQGELATMVGGVSGELEAAAIDRALAVAIPIARRNLHRIEEKSILTMQKPRRLCTSPSFGQFRTWSEIAKQPLWGCHQDGGYPGTK